MMRYKIKDINDAEKVGKKGISSFTKNNSFRSLTKAFFMIKIFTSINKKFKIFGLFHVIIVLEVIRMSYKKRNRYVKAISFFILCGIGLTITIISGFNLFNSNLILFETSGESTINITEPGEYYVLLDTDGVRHSTLLETVGVTNNLTVSDKEETELFKSALLFSGANDSTSTLITNLEFDKQIRHKGYLGFGIIDLEKKEYNFNGVEVNASDDFGGYALLSANYVTRIGFFSFGALTTILLGLLGFKFYREVGKIPMSKYKKKHMVK